MWESRGESTYDIGGTKREERRGRWRASLAIPMWARRCVCGCCCYRRKPRVLAAFVAIEVMMAAAGEDCVAIYRGGGVVTGGCASTCEDATACSASIHVFLVQKGAGGYSKDAIPLPCSFYACRLVLRLKRVKVPPDAFLAIVTPVVDSTPCAVHDITCLLNDRCNRQLQHGSMWCVEWDPLTPSRLAIGPSSCSPVSIFDVEHQRLTAVAQVTQAGRKRAILFRLMFVSRPLSSRRSGTVAFILPTETSRPALESPP